MSIALGLLAFVMLSLLFLAAFVYYMLFQFIIPMLWQGAIFARSKNSAVEAMLDLADASLGQKAVDVGSGDGRVVIAMAQRGLDAHGYEINPFLVLISKRSIKKLGLQSRAHIYWKNFWNEDFSRFDVVTIYGISYIMDKLEAKLKRELNPGAKVVSNYFTFSLWQPKTMQNNIYLYEK